MRDRSLACFSLLLLVFAIQLAAMALLRAFPPSFARSSTQVAGLLACGLPAAMAFAAWAIILLRFKAEGVSSRTCLAAALLMDLAALFCSMLLFLALGAW